MLESQITDKSKKGLGYSAVPPPHPLIYNRPNKLDLSYSGLDEFKEPEFKGYGLENSKKESNVVCEKESDNSKENSDKSLVKEQESQVKSSFVKGCGSNTSKNVSEVEPKKVRKNNDALIIEDWVSDDEEQDESLNKVVKKKCYSTAAKIEKPVKKSVRYAEMYRSQRPRGNQRNWNGQKSNQLDTECLVLSPNFKLPDENQILLKVPRKDNMYSFDMKNIVPKESLTCLVAKATLDESMLWHRRLGHINFKNINKLVKDNLVRGLPIKRFENDQTCVACLKGKQHRASCKSKVLNPITKPLFMLHMDLFGPTFVSSLMHKKYCLVVTDDYSRFTWVFFLTTKDETSEILKRFIKEIENLVDKKVKIIRSDNGTEFKNKVMDDFCREKGIKREYSVARTPQQNGVAERRNRTLIEAARTMLADSKLPTIFWAEAVSTACYVQNRVLVVKPHNKTPYELFRGFKPTLSFMRPFGCHVTILNTLDSLGKFVLICDEVSAGTVSNISADTQGQIKVLPPRTTEEILARERERKARTTLLMALPEDHLAKFHKMTDAKEMWDAIKSRFGGNDESKKMQKYILKQQFEGFSVSNSEGLHKGYDRTKPGVDSLSFDDLYNNLRVFENDVKGSTASSSSTQNVAFVSENTSSTNDVSTAYSVSNPSGQNSQYEQTSSYSLLANQSSCPQLDHEDLEQLDEYDLEEMDLKWQVAMISMRMKKFYKKTGRKLQFDAKEPVGFDKTKVECYNCHKTGHFARECRNKGNQDSRRRDAWNSGNKDGRRSGKQEDSNALVTIDGEGVDWTSHSEEEDYALMACNSSGSDTEVTSCSNECKESYAKLKKLYDAQREQLSDASIEIKAYTQGLKKVEAQLVAHQQGQLWYEQKIKFMKIDLDDKTDVLTYHKKLLAEAQKEKDDLKAKVEKWHNSSKNLGKLLNSQMSAHDKFGLGYGDHRYDGILSYENEVLQSVFMGKESDFENPPLYDRFVTAGGMHAVPPPMTGNYMPSGPDIEIDYSQFTYGPKQTQPSESETQTSEFDTCESNISTETPELVSEPVVNESNVECQPKVWSDAPIIEEYESDSEDEYVSLPTKEQETPSFANQQVKSPRETVKNHFTHSKNPKVDKKELGYGFTARACFVCGSLNHLIRDCDFHEKRMAKQAVLNNRLKRNSSQREIRPIWNNVQRVNHQNQFVPTAVLTRTGKIPVNTASSTKNVSTARHNFNKQTVLTNVAMKVNTVKPIVNRVRPANVFHKTHSPFSRPFNNTTALRTNFSKQKVNTAKVNTVSAVGGKRETAVKPSAGCNWRPQRHHNWHKDYPHRALQNKGIVDSGCSRHMTGNKAYLAEYQDFNGGPVAFGGSKGYITGKGKIKTGKLDFEDVCFVKELQHFNLFFVSQMCDKKNKVLFTDSECLVLSPEFKLPDENQVLLRIPRQNNMYSFNLENIVPSGGLACLIAKATIDESNKWHRRLGHVNFKNLNKLVKGNLVRGLPSKIFQNDHTCVACQKGKQHKASVESAQDYFVLPIWSSYTSIVKSTKAKNTGKEPNKHPNLKPVDKEDQVFLDELEILKRQEQDANDAAEVLRKEFA
ncbi:ribonuclease H-like domain-containing protein [Tanacetum coccineum]